MKTEPMDLVDIDFWGNRTVKPMNIVAYKGIEGLCKDAGMAYPVETQFEITLEKGEKEGA